ncbi:hypothetical protein [Anatilimnocola floriformis]|uniref:hypothetical protein n=1 Tax=Anatilimnocola floriformis TaxID=2948575 RepID=UPI0020C47F9F|nr:hypothetical protein [Anatilimnocola floriformis]
MKIATRDGKIITYVGLFGTGIRTTSSDCCCPSECPACSGSVPSGWSLYFYNTIDECGCLEGETITIDRGTPLTGSDPLDCGGYIVGAPNVCSTATGRIRWIGINIGESGPPTYLRLSMRIDTDQEFFGVTPPIGSYSFSGNLGADPEAATGGPYDCTEGGTIHVDGWVTRFSAELIHFGFDCDVTPIP